MAAGLVTLNILDGDGTTRTARFWSSDGTTAGLLYPPAVALDAAGAPVFGTVGAPEAGTVLDVLTGILTAATDTSDVNIKGPPSAIVSATPTVSTTAYTSGDCIGGLMTFSAVTRGAGLAAILQTALIQCKSTQSFAADLILFHTSPASSTFTDNSAIALNAADFDKVTARVPFASTDWSNLGTPSVAEVSAQGRLVKSVGTDLYAVLVARGTPTLGSTSDLKVVLKAMPD